MSDFFKKIFGGKESSSVGVDIGSSSIKVIELEKQVGGLNLKNYAIAQGSGFLVKANSSGLIGEAAGAALDKIFQKAGITNRNVNVSVPGFASLVTTIEVPKTNDDKEMEKMVVSEAPKYIPVKLSDVVYGWEIINDPEINAKPEAAKGDFAGLGGGGNAQGKVKILVVAIMKEISNQYEKVLQKYGFKIESLEIDCFSITRSLLGMDTGSYVILDMGHQICNVIIVVNRSIFLSRSIDVAGEKITKTIAQGLNLDPKRAETQKMAGDFQSQAAVSEQVSGIFEKISDEIKKTLDVFRRNYPLINIKGIILSGGTAKMTGLKEHLEKKLISKTIFGNPFLNINFNPALREIIVKQAPFLSVAVGLAMLGFDEKK